MANFAVLPFRYLPGPLSPSTKDLQIGFNGVCWSSATNTLR
jgi:hypothetical protein